MYKNLKEKKFKDYAVTPDNPKWENCITRTGELYKREKEVRSEFERDYNRIINS